MRRHKATAMLALVLNFSVRCSLSHIKVTCDVLAHGKVLSFNFFQIVHL